jgi:hypothetical protein
MRSRNPSALASGIPDQQPIVAGIFGCDFLIGLVAMMTSFPVGEGAAHQTVKGRSL